MANFALCRGRVARCCIIKNGRRAGEATFRAECFYIDRGGACTFPRAETENVWPELADEVISERIREAKILEATKDIP
jgi:hypothetical protein